MPAAISTIPASLTPLISSPLAIQPTASLAFSAGWAQRGVTSDGCSAVDHHEMGESQYFYLLGEGLQRR
jgi:hypothetical protein